ncbi:tetratricopeptide repeat protein [Aequorivita todarodis]|uniref:tetratricopeptide repeat-containing sensor histidine kinase n=1 Tax=Aequorivita todarodis TaxID=2036821 RepID=UPI00235008D2|nr:ATP-binding protein [Aequorivita todarodis]MDC8001800.1 tetratricopeptide repeat protein [Aequorivita todarodis]
MKRILLLTSFFIVSSFSFSQQGRIDSLKAVLHATHNTTARLKILKKLCEKSSEINALEETQIYYDELLKIANETKDEKNLVYGYQLLLKEFEKKRDSIKALEYFHKSHKINLKNKDYLNLAKDYNGLGGIYNKFQLYEKAEDAYTKALDICSQNNLDYIGKVYINLAIVNQNQNDYTISTQYALKARDFAEKKNNLKEESDALGIIAGNYMWLNNNEKAEEFYKEALLISEGKDFFLTNLNHYRGLATTYSRMRIPDKALEYNFKALKMLENYGDRIYILDVMISIAGTYNRTGNTKKAYEYYYKALKIANELDSKAGRNAIEVNLTFLKVNEGKYNEAEKIILKTLNDTIDRVALPETSERSAYILLSMIYEGKKDFEKSLHYHKKYFRLAYDILSKSQSESVAELDTKYQTEKKEKENLALKKQNAEKELAVQRATNLNLTYGILAGTAILGLIGFFYYSKTRRRKLRDEHIISLARAKQKEHEKIGADLHSTKAKELEKIAGALEEKGEMELARRTRDIKENIRLLSHELFQIPFSQEEFDDQIINLLYDYNSSALKITHDGISSIKWAEVDDTIKRNLYLIISEAISNIKNHSKATQASVKFQKRNKKIDVTITDNGIGFTDEDLKKGHGIGNMRMRANEIKGTIRFDAVKNQGSEIGIFITL